MKRIIPFFLIIFFASGVFAQVGTLTVTNVASTPGTGETVIHYEFSGQAGTYDITAEVSFNNGASYVDIPDADLTGDVSEVNPGGPYSISWDGMASFPETYSEETVIRLTAEFVYFLSLQSDPSEGGTATDETNTGPYKVGTVIDIKAEANTGYSFVNWTAPAGSFGDAEAMETTFTMPAQHVTITANFCEWPDAPVAHDATGITTSSFTANWEAVPDAVTYTLDVAEDIDFNTFVTDYEGLEVGDVTSHTVVGLVSDTTYYYRVKVTDACGTSEYSNTVSIITDTPPFPCGDDITFTYREEDVTYGTILRNGLCWMDRNLGADPMPFDPTGTVTNTNTSLFGDRFQWGRLDDGHQVVSWTSSTEGVGTTTTTAVSETDVPGHGDFIIADSNPHDWRDDNNDNRWNANPQVNNPCPPGWRVPTEAELDAERESWSPNNSAGAYASTLKWPVGGRRTGTGELIVGNDGRVWSSSVSDDYRARALNFSSDDAYMDSHRRASGRSVRCVTDVPDCELPPAPNATDATGVTTSTFTANWDAVAGALNYTLDVALDDGFLDFVDGYGGLDVGDVTSHTVVGLVSNTTYYYRVTATDGCGTSEYSNTVIIITDTPPFPCGDNITFTYRGSTVTYGTIERGGLCWMDRNLGASRVPESSTDSEGFGDLFQWGRLDDGHQDRESTVVQTQSNTDDPGHNQFIGYDPNSFPVRDWRNPQNDALWQGEDGVNNPCPPGWRVPTETELDEERASWGVSNQNAEGAYDSSTLKWPTGGLRYDNGSYSSGGGNVWSSSVSSESARYLRFRPKSHHLPEGDATISTTRRGGGQSVRCVKSLD